MTNSSDKKKEKRDRILQTATDLFSKKGFAETTISDVAKAANVSFGSVFTYFDTKEALFEAAVTEPFEAINALFLHYPFDPKNYLKSLKQMVKAHTAYFAQNENVVRLLQQVLGQYERFPKLFDVLNTFLHDVTTAYGEIILEGQNQGVLYKRPTESVVISYLSYLNGIRLTIIDPADHPIWEELAVQGYYLFGPIQTEEIKNESELS